MVALLHQPEGHQPVPSLMYFFTEIPEFIDKFLFPVEEDIIIFIKTWAGIYIQIEGGYLRNIKQNQGQKPPQSGTETPQIRDR